MFIALEELRDCVAQCIFAGTLFREKGRTAWIVEFHTGQEYRFRFFPERGVHALVRQSAAEATLVRFVSPREL